MGFFHRHRFSAKAVVATTLAALLLTGCEELGVESGGAGPGRAAQSGGASVEKDVGRPDIFSVTENALWDGRPSLGGVWVAYPAIVGPERVVIRNTASGKSVIGALFRRERENPGPKIQLSSDAAVALGVIAGAPTEISIVVMRREAVEVDPPVPETGAVVDDNMEPPARRAVAAAPVPVPAPVAPAIVPAEGLVAIVEDTLDNVAESTAEQVPQVSRLRKPYIQAGTFEVESQANDLVDLLAEKGVVAQVQGNDEDPPTLWRVISGPYMTRAERTAQLRIIKGLGFADAFFFR